MADTDPPTVYPVPLSPVPPPFISFPTTRRYPPRRPDRVIIIRPSDEESMYGGPSTNSLFWFAGLLFIVNMLIKIAK